MIVLALAALLQADGAEPRPEPATFRCLGVTWKIPGAVRVETAIRRAGEADWKPAAPLFRVDPTLLAGSLVDLDPDTPYEVRLTRSGPDGQTVERILGMRTRAEPRAPEDATIVHVHPGPRALRDAERKAKPGTLFLLHAGVYRGPFNVSKSGEPGRPVVWRAAGDGETVIDGGGNNVIEAGGAHDVWFEGLTLRNGLKGINAGEAARLVIRRCRFRAVSYGVFCTVNRSGRVEDFLISDNDLEGPCTWPRTKGIEPERAIQVTGTGHVIRHNRIRGFADAIDTMPSARCSAIDIYRNEIDVMTDDGIELDFSRRNIRCFENRLTNVFQGISAQPVKGGPAYVFRNVLVNVVLEPFKLHNRTSGVLLYHNTVVKRGTPFLVLANEPVRNCVSRNNLFVGTAGGYAALFESPMERCDFDRDGFSGGPWKPFLKWNGRRYATPGELRERGPAFRSAVLLAPAEFPIPKDPSKRHPPGFDPRLGADSKAVDAGAVLPGFNDGFSGSAPDLGAVEAGAALPLYGPRE